MSLFNNLSYSLVVLVLLCVPMPSMASKRKLQGVHEQNHLHDRQERRAGLDKQRRSERKKFTPPPQAESKEIPEATDAE